MDYKFSILEPSAVVPHLQKLSAYAAAVGIRIASTQPRSNQSIAFSNFCNYVSGELKQVASFFPSNTPALAWSCRNLFETDLTVRYVLLSEQNFIDWMGQALRDERDFIEGALSLALDGHAEQTDVLRARREHLNNMATRHGLEFSRPFRVGDVAKAVGEEAEYIAMYKLFSKYVHPSSLLINSWAKTEPAMEWTNIFLTSAQRYAHDAIERLRKASGVGEISLA
jgi:hypothetical protein